MLTGNEYFSDAKALEPVMWKDETGEEIDTGLVRCLAVKQTAGGIKLAGVGGSGAGAGFGGEKAEDDEGGGDDGEEAEETKCVQLRCWRGSGVGASLTHPLSSSTPSPPPLPFAQAGPVLELPQH
jgi:hypothetical protein